jgi:hypothetical protein
LIALDDFASFVTGDAGKYYTPFFHIAAPGIRPAGDSLPYSLALAHGHRLAAVQQIGSF